MEKRIRLKKKLFLRDGGEDVYGLYCDCFTCGTELRGSGATLDRYPIPGKYGGEYILENLKLACVRCNTNAGSKRIGVLNRSQKKMLLTRLRLEQNLKPDQAPLITLDIYYKFLKEINGT